MLFDTDTSDLFIDVGWGSGNGFTDLSSNVSLLNIHGPTTDGAPDSYGQNAGAMMPLTGIDPSPVSGGFTGTVEIPSENVNDLLTGRLYLHIHTDDFGGGEARGYFIPASANPEPASAGIAMLAGSLILVRRRRSVF